MKHIRLPIILGAFSSGIVHGAIVQIDLTRNVLGSAGGAGGISSFNPDITGDGVDEDLTAAFSTSATLSSPTITLATAGYNSALSPFAYVRQGGVTPANWGGRGNSPGEFSGLSPFTVTDPKINGNAPTDVWLDLTARNESTGRHYIQINRIIFDDTSTSRPSTVDQDTAYPSIGNVEDGVFTPVPELSSAVFFGLAGTLALLRRR
ncbi:hypothetical protein [Haloferula sargassicola]|uniref:PEP-CTERM sorting domain-containing protein n=1 Tax=Haloferula sargassicola TaxID=490096 RepID=A0ABP9UQ11_9BACT